MKTPQLFINLYKGKEIDDDGAYGVQCVDGYRVFCKWIKLGAYQTGTGYADGYWYNRDNVASTFDFIYNANELQKGDWCFWAMGSSCPSSHVAMFVGYAEEGFGYFFGENQGNFRGFSTVKIKLDILGAFRWKQWEGKYKMTMNGIDVSHYQHDLDLSKIQYDFVIAKSTEGIGWVDASCDRFIQQAIAQNKKWGFYHFARPTNNPVEEARFWYENTKNYFGQGLPVLDIEIHASNVVDWCYQFLSEIIKLTGVKPMVYMSEQSFEWAYDWTPVVNLDCGLWLAAYRGSQNIYDYNYPTTWQIPTPHSWKFIAMWQYTSHGYIQGYNANVDCDVFFAGQEVWDKYCAPSQAVEEPTKPIEDHTEPIQPPVEEKPTEPTPAPETPVIEDDDYLFKMSNNVYDLLNWLVHITPLFITFYIALAKIWGWPNTDSYIATVSAFMAFINSILRQSTIGYQKRKGK